MKICTVQIHAVGVFSLYREHDPFQQQRPLRTDMGFACARFSAHQKKTAHMCGRGENPIDVATALLGLPS